MRSLNHSSPDIGELLFSADDLAVSVADSESFCINSLELANWAARKVVEHRERIRERKEMADVYITRIKSWLEKAIQEDNSSIDFLTSHLRPFVERELSKQRRSRTLLLPGSSLSMRKKPDTIEVTDEAAALSYCENFLPEAIIIRKSLSKTVLKAAIKKGEMPPSVEYIPGGDELYIEADSSYSIEGKLDVA